MWKIANLKIKTHVVLGPMAGVTSLSYREFMKPFGVGLSVSEMVSDCGLDYGNHKTFEYLATSEIDRPVAIQLFGGKIETTIKAIEILEKTQQNYDILDINLGCPVPKVTNSGAGSAWLKRPLELYEYMSAIVKKSSKPVTAKIRLGWDEKSINVFEIVDLLEKAGVSAIAIHARTTKQGYSGKPNFEIIRDLGKKMNVPLIISGDIYSVQDAINAKNVTGATAIMVARGGIGNPKLITAISNYFENENYEISSSLDEQILLCDNYVKTLIKEKGETVAMKISRGITPKFFLGFPSLKSYRNELAQSVKTYQDFKTILKNIGSQKSRF